MVRLESVSKTFNMGTVDQKTAIDNISLTIKEGDFITIIGSNGAGKTTLFNLVSGSYFPTSGNIIINERDVTSDPEYKRAKYIGRIFQDPLLGTAGNMSIEDNMMVASKKGFKWPVISLNNKKREEFKKRLVDLDMNLQNRIRENVSLLSGGQRQALTLLMMVLSKPEFVLLDEHTAALDPKNAAKVLELTTGFINEYNLTTMMITHNMEHAIAYGNRLLMMDGGRIILDVSGDEKHDLTREKLVQKFHEIKHDDLANDELLLS